MGLGDLGDKAKEEVDEEQTEELTNKLGVESKEELKRLDDRLSGLAKSQVESDREMERLEDEIDDLRLTIRSILTVLDDYGMLTSMEEVRERREKRDDPWQSTQ